MRKSGLFVPVKAGTLKDGIVRLLTDAILSNQIKPGERLNESRLAREFRVSRAPIREALQQLQEQGLVTNSPRRGMFVVRLERQDIQKINSLRLIIEAEALRLCRANIAPQGKKKLAQLLKRMEQTREAGWVELSRLDFKFHRTIWSFTGNEYLAKVLTSLVVPLFAYNVITYMSTNEPAELAADLHRPLLEYVTGKSKLSPEELLLTHLRRAGWDRPEHFSSFALSPKEHNIAVRSH